jgi:hypothetical protein
LELEEGPPKGEDDSEVPDGSGALELEEKPLEPEERDDETKLEDG